MGATSRPTQAVTANDALRFLLELAAVGALAWWGFRVADGALGVALGLGVPAFAAAAWGTFRVPNDPSPNPPVEVPGIVRLMIEFDVFTAATAALWFGGAATVAVVFAVLVAAHYAIARQRVLRLLRDRRRGNV